MKNVVYKNVEEKYTTADKQKAEPIKEKDKVVVSNDTYAICEAMDNLAIRIAQVRFG